MTAAMDILQVQRVIMGLINCSTVERVCPNLELNDNHRPVQQDHDVSALAHPWNCELKKYMGAGHPTQACLKQTNLTKPRRALLMLKGKAMPLSHRAQDRIRVSREKLSDRCGEIGNVQHQ